MAIGDGRAQRPRGVFSAWTDTTAAATSAPLPTTTTIAVNPAGIAVEIAAGIAADPSSVATSSTALPPVLTSVIAVENDEVASVDEVTSTTSTSVASEATLPHVQAARRRADAAANRRVDKMRQRFLAMAEQIEPLGPHVGGRRMRRWENVAMLVQSTQLEAADLVPSAPTKPSVFDRLLADPILLRCWYRFARLSEAEQTSVLAHMATLAASTRGASPAKPTAPMTAEQCYARIQRSTRDMLRRSNLSPVLLNALESDLLDALAALARTAADGPNRAAATSSSSSADSDLWVWRFDDAYRRGLAHAVCQYYGLRTAASGTEDAAVRVCLLAAPPAAPSLPPIRLTEFLATTTKATRWRTDDLADLVLSPPHVHLAML